MDEWRKQDLTKRSKEIDRIIMDSNIKFLEVSNSLITMLMEKKNLTEADADFIMEQLDEKFMDAYGAVYTLYENNEISDADLINGIGSFLQQDRFVYELVCNAFKNDFGKINIKQMFVPEKQDKGDDANA